MDSTPTLPNTPPRTPVEGERAIRVTLLVRLAPLTASQLREQRLYDADAECTAAEVGPAELADMVAGHVESAGADGGELWAGTGHYARLVEVEAVDATEVGVEAAK